MSDPHGQRRIESRGDGQECSNRALLGGGGGGFGLCNAYGAEG
jgi:hypothetical protein